MKPLVFIIPPEEDGEKLKFILRRRMGLSMSLMKRLKWEDSRILLNGVSVFVSAIVHTGDTVEVDISDIPAPNGFLPFDLPLDIVWEDDYLLVINKPAGHSVHSSTLSQNIPSIASALAYRYGTDAPLHFANRLDKGTTGLMVNAKCAYVHEALKRQLQAGTFFREYLASAEGSFSEPDGIIHLPIAREEDSLLKRKISPDGKDAITEYHVLQSNAERSLVHVIPRTGRTHQIRLHFSAIGHPLTGDWLYGTEVPFIQRPALHSWKLTLEHPITKKRIELTCPMPQDIQSLFKENSL